jgi:formyltetrahydrofolate hydrolase
MTLQADFNLFIASEDQQGVAAAVAKAIVNRDCIMTESADHGIHDN